MLPKTSSCVDLIEIFITVWDKFSADIKKNLIESLYTLNNFLKTKIKSLGDEVTDFYDKEIPKVRSNHTCFAVISWNSTLKKDGNYYPQVFLIVF